MDFNLLLRAKPYVAQHLKKDFAAFCRAAWPHLHPGSKLSWTPAHDLICEFLVSVYRGDIRRLIVNTPPRFSKSSIAAILFPIWCWLQNPMLAFLICSYEIDLATAHNVARYRLMGSAWFRELFGDCFELAADRAQAGDFSNTAGGQMASASVNSKAQGRGGDLLVVDDPLSADFAYSESFRNETNAWFTNQLPQRLNNPSESAIVVIAQRLHQNDPCGFLLSQEDSEWTLLKLPLIAEEDEKVIFPISGRVWKRKKGDCLDAKRWSPRTVRERQRDRLTFASQFQQSPMAAEGNLIRTEDILYFGGRDPQTGAMDPGLPESFERKLISVDCSFKDLRSSDYVAIVVVGVVGSRRYLLHVTNAHLDLLGTMNEIRNARAAYGPVSATLIESAANGAAIINALKEEFAGVVPITVRDSKMARLVSTAPEFQAHNWIIERNGPWTHKVVEQLTMFPNAKNDDIADAISQASVWLQSHTYELGFIDYLKGVAAGLIRRPEPKPKPAAPGPAQQPRPEASSKPKEVTYPFCKKCHGKVMLRPFGNTPSAGDLRCPQCSRVYDRAGNLMSEPPQEDPKHVHRWREIPGGILRCDDDPSHIRYIDGQPPTTNGMSRAQYQTQRGLGRFR